METWSPTVTHHASVVVGEGRWNVCRSRFFLRREVVNWYNVVELNVYRLIRLSVTTACRPPHDKRTLFFRNKTMSRWDVRNILISTACQLENDNDNKFPIKQGNNKFYEFLAASASSFFSHIYKTQRRRWLRMRCENSFYLFALSTSSTS